MSDDPFKPIVRKLVCREETTEEEWRALAQNLDGMGRLLGTSVEDGRYCITAQFKNAIDQLAFETVMSAADRFYE